MNQSGRMERVREALDGFKADGYSERSLVAALTEIEEWETRMAEVERRADWLYCDAEDKHGEIKELEAEADRLKAALTEYAWMGTDDEVERGDLQRAIRALAALAPADRNTT